MLTLNPCVWICLRGAYAKSLDDILCTNTQRELTHEAFLLATRLSEKVRTKKMKKRSIGKQLSKRGVAIRFLRYGQYFVKTSWMDSTTPGLCRASNCSNGFSLGGIVGKWVGKWSTRQLGLTHTLRIPYANHWPYVGQKLGKLKELLKQEMHMIGTTGWQICHCHLHLWAWASVYLQRKEWKAITDWKYSFQLIQVEGPTSKPDTLRKRNLWEKLTHPCATQGFAYAHGSYDPPKTNQYMRGFGPCSNAMRCPQEIIKCRPQ